MRKTCEYFSKNSRFLGRYLNRQFQHARSQLTRKVTCRDLYNYPDILVSDLVWCGMCTHFWKQPAVHWGKEVSSLVGVGKGRRRNSTVVGKNKLSSYKTNREEIDRGSGRVCIIFKLFGFASLRKRFPFVTLPLHPFAVSRFACVVRHLSYSDGNSLRTNVSLFLSHSFPLFLSFLICVPFIGKHEYLCWYVPV